MIGQCCVVLGYFTDALEYFGSAVLIQKRVSKQVSVDQELALYHIEQGICLFKMKKYNEAKTLLAESLTILQNLGEELMAKEIAETSNKMGGCCVELGLVTDALTYSGLAVSTQKRFSKQECTDQNLALYYHNHGICLLNMETYNEAKIHLVESLMIRTNLGEKLMGKK